MRECLQAICNPITFNPDLAGIGIFSSFIIQLAIAMVAGTILIILSEKKHRRSSRNERHAETLVTALVDFHRNQYCFTIAVQIATVVYNSKPYTWSSDNLDVVLVLILVGIGTVPITFVFICLTYYGRPSWYLKSLTLLTFLVSTGVLVMFTIYTAPGGPADLKDRFEDVWTQELSGSDCGYYDSIISWLCGTSTPGTNSHTGDSVIFSWTWAAWTLCLVWGSGSMFQGTPGRKSDSLRAELAFKFAGPIHVLRLKVLGRYEVWKIFFVLMWAICFAFQLYTSAIYVHRSLISMTWSFGQIVAVTVWAPCLVEFFYIEYNGLELTAEYKNPPLYDLVRRPGKAVKKQNTEPKNTTT